METYYNPEDLAKFSPDGVGEGAPELWDLYMAYYGKVFAEGELTAREKALIALAVAAAVQCPYCIDSYTNTCMEMGVTKVQAALGGLGGCRGYPCRKDLWPVGGRRAGQQRGHPGSGLGAGAGHRRAGGPGQPGHQPGRPAGAARRRRRRHPGQRGGTGELKLPASG